MNMYDWQPRMLKCLVRAFTTMRAELDAMCFALRCANLYSTLLERELIAGEAKLTAIAERQATR